MKLSRACRNCAEFTSKRDTTFTGGGVLECMVTLTPMHNGPELSLTHRNQIDRKQLSRFHRPKRSERQLVPAAFFPSANRRRDNYYN